MANANYEETMKRREKEDQEKEMILRDALEKWKDTRQLSQELLDWVEEILDVRHHMAYLDEKECLRAEAKKDIALADKLQEAIGGVGLCRYCVGVVVWCTTPHEKKDSGPVLEYRRRRNRLAFRPLRSPRSRRATSACAIPETSSGDADDDSRVEAIVAFDSSGFAPRETKV